MVKSLNPKVKFLFECAFGVLIVVLFSIVAWGLYSNSITRFLAKRQADRVGREVNKLLARPTQCAPGQVEIKHADGLLCRNDVAASVWRDIYDNNDFDPKGKERILSFLGEGDISIADQYLNDFHYVPRYDSVRIPAPVTWKEDPYKEKYWRFIFYSLRSTEQLLNAWEKTGKPEYRDKFIEILQSYLDTGMQQEHSWDDNHAVAFRTMVLVDAWWRLREHGELSVELSTKILQALKQHGDFLADRNHYEPQYNHGLNEAAALYLLASDFPDIPGAVDWKKTSEERIISSLEDAVDDDGALLENSPYYHFYSLEKYWEILEFTEKRGLQIEQKAKDKIKRMISYAAYVLQPDGQTPLLGASLKRTINDSGIEAEIASMNPELLYVLSDGDKGKRPSLLSVHYDTTGQTIMRSGWGRGATYAKQTQLIFDVGAYRTNHSDLDALSFSLYGEGITLMPDSGLYTYEDSPIKSYFKGTSAHNTVVVDGQDQKQGTAVAGEFHQEDGYAYQTAEHDLYNGVTHERAIALLGERLVLVIDHLKSNDEHKYEQMFHLFPGAKIEQNGFDVTGFEDKSGGKQITIHQMLTDGVKVGSAINETSPSRGVCSEEYQRLIPCYSIDYAKNGKNVDFVTLLEIGKPSKNLKAELSSDGKKVQIDYGDTAYQINVTSISDIKSIAEVQNNQPIVEQQQGISNFLAVNAWKKNTQNNDVKGYLSFNDINGKPALTLKSPTNSTWVEAERDLPLNLTKKNFSIRIKIDDAENIRNLELSFSSNDWLGYATERLSNAYSTDYSGEWLTITLGKGQLRDKGGQWSIYGKGFSWGSIDKIKLRIKSLPGKSSTLLLSDFNLIPAQEKGNIVIVFDDGAYSVTPAAKLLNEQSLKANIAVISSRVEGKNGSYLSLRELQELQNSYGWSILNHSWLHKNALEEYLKNNDLHGLEEDVLRGAEFLQKNGINTDQNWYIPPNGAVNGQIKSVIGKYYKFARVVQNGPEVFPFGDSLGVKTLSVQNTVSPESVIDAIADAEKYKQTLFLTFHRIQTDQQSLPGYYKLDDFKKIINYLVQQGIKPKTVNELDEANGVSLNVLKITDGRPEQIGLKIVKRTGLQKILSEIKGKLPFVKQN